MFDIAEHRFAFLLENLRNWQAGVAFLFRNRDRQNAGEPRGEQTPHGCSWPEPIKAGQPDHAGIPVRVQSQTSSVGDNPRKRFRVR